MREPGILRPRITPDPERAAELQRRIDALQYRPETGFHRDRVQQRRDARPIERPLSMFLRRQAG
jgi:hypothetical protein